ncbi:Hsp20/alpha crystallin family protein [bacterium]|nr:Hsp20/alpha crystallin family protein [bacterium]
MRHWTLFDDLREFQEETNRFFEDIYRRLSMFEMAMSRWYNLDEPVEVEYERRFERRVRQPEMTNESIHRYRTVERRARMPISQPEYNYEYAAEASPYKQPVYESTGHSTLQSGSRQALPSGMEAAIEMSESANEIIASVNLPGLRKGDIDITVSNNMLNIRGKINKNIALPPGINPDKIKASYRNGVLELRLSKEKRVNVNFE